MMKRPGTWPMTRPAVLPRCYFQPHDQMPKREDWWREVRAQQGRKTCWAGMLMGAQEEGASVRRLRPQYLVRIDDRLRVMKEAVMLLEETPHQAY
jgi:hypothetical protein